MLDDVQETGCDVGVRTVQARQKPWATVQLQINTKLACLRTEPFHIATSRLWRVRETEDQTPRQRRVLLDPRELSPKLAGPTPLKRVLRPHDVAVEEQLAGDDGVATPVMATSVRLEFG